MQELWKYEKLLSLGNYMCLNKVPRIKFAEFEETNQNQSAIYNYIVLNFLFFLLHKFWKDRDNFLTLGSREWERDK